MTDWHVSIHACEIQKYPGKEILWKGQKIDSIDVGATGLNQPFSVLFDQFIDRVNTLAGGYAEGDGSFGICGPGGTWKICGTIFEVNDAIHYAELMGRCPRSTLIAIVSQLGADLDGTVFQIMQGGFFVAFEQFWKLVQPPCREDG